MTVDTEERINVLCRKALKAQSDVEVERVMAALRIAIYEHVNLAKITLLLQASLIPDEKAP